MEIEVFIKEHPDLNVVEMDSVEGTRDSTKVLLTLFFRNCSLMLAYLREANITKSVTEVTDMFYCDPQRPDQKGSIEVTHEFIRRIVPKKTSFAFLT